MWHDYIIEQPLIQSLESIPVVSSKTRDAVFVLKKKLLVSFLSMRDASYVMQRVEWLTSLGRWVVLTGCSGTLLAPLNGETLSVSGAFVNVRRALQLSLQESPN